MAGKWFMRLALLGLVSWNAGCCGLCNRWCGTNQPQPVAYAQPVAQPVYAGPQQCVPCCPPGTAPVASYPRAPVAYSAPGAVCCP